MFGVGGLTADSSTGFFSEMATLGGGVGLATGGAGEATGAGVDLTDSTGFVFSVCTFPLVTGGLGTALVGGDGSCLVTGAGRVGLLVVSGVGDCTGAADAGVGAVTDTGTDNEEVDGAFARGGSESTDDDSKSSTGVA